jgi:hypothetical protein
VLQQMREAFRRPATWTWLMLAVSVLGFVLRVEHALTFDHVHRASDYDVHLQGVRWMQRHWRPFFFSPSVNYQVRSYPPLWYFLSAVVLRLQDNERLLAIFSVSGWVLRQAVLWLVMKQALPERRLSRLAALSIHALLPLSVLIDGKVNPEGLHSGIFALALYALWQLERQSQAASHLSLKTAAAFGALAGLALLAKITGGMLVMIGPLVLGLQTLRLLRREGWSRAFRTMAPAALAAAAAWCLVAGFWSGHNLLKLGHPFPHVWSMEGAKDNPILADPALYRRPLGWALPFEWRGLWDVPLIRTDTDPRPNFWATEVVGTWSDVYNRGFCRLEGGGVIDRFWGARHGFMSQHSDAWNVSGRCVDWFASMVHVGVWLSGAAVLAVLWCLWQSLSSFGARGSLTLAVVPLLCTASAMSFAMAYPYDHTAVLNPRYLLSQVMPMSACFGLALGQLETWGKGRGPLVPLARAAAPLALGLIAVIGGMLFFERFGS